jgi:hypothetical protein
LGSSARIGAAPTLNGDLQTGTLQSVNEIQKVDVNHRLVAGGIAFAFVFFVASFCAGKPTGKFLAFGNPLSYCVGVDNRTSNSQTQMVLWSGTLLVVYLTTVLLRAWSKEHLIGGVDIPTNLLAFSGLSALSFGGARAITVSKQNVAVAAVAAANTTTDLAARAKAHQDTSIKSAPNGTANITQLFNNDRNRLDLGDTRR